ncbi:hypothetical protein [Dysgonomonas sp. 511]|uniref:hypothetical protein n=1 Tax=Dysgonomonas sp. 511 TaxID=2302930 RepID=UPI0013D4243F|nr:hypothetical protein [Dysgonomonas sp. 511]NDV78571.1 hypothetical protein [Dysgonomonas sp. 511]
MGIIIFLAFALNMKAQVTIGSDYAPEQGALLQLKETNNPAGINSTRGMKLPRVPLVSLTAPGDDLRKTIEGGENIAGEKWDLGKHAGLMIYNPRMTDCESKGIYVWSGSKWEGIGTTQETPWPGSHAEDLAAIDQFLKDNPSVVPYWPTFTANPGSSDWTWNISPGEATWETATEVTRARISSNKLTFGSGWAGYYVTRELWKRDCSGELRLRELDVVHKNITDASALKGLKALRNLLIHDNPLEELDLSGLGELAVVDIDGCINLKSIVFGDNPNLVALNVGKTTRKKYDIGTVSATVFPNAGDRIKDTDDPYRSSKRDVTISGVKHYLLPFNVDTKLTQIKNLAECPNLKGLIIIDQVSFSGLDLKGNPELTRLEIKNGASETGGRTGKRGEIEDLPLAYNPKLKTLVLEYNSVEALDLSKNLDLTNITITNELLVGADLKFPVIPVVTSLSMSSNSALNVLNLGSQVYSLGTLSLYSNTITSDNLNALVKQFSDAGLCDFWNNKVGLYSKPACP